MENENNTKKRKGRITVKKTVIVFICMIVLIIGIVTCIYNIRNYKLYRYVISTENETLDIYYNFKYMLIWDKTINYIKENKKEVNFIGKEYTITIPSYEISKFYNFNINIFDKVSTDEKFKELNTCIIDLSRFDDLYGIRKINAKLSDKLLENYFVDIYKCESESILLYKNVPITNDGYVNFNIEEDSNITKYIIVYVPLDDIIVENDKFEINNNSSLNIELRTIPENATFGNFKYFCDNENLVITQDGVVNAKEAGEYQIQISDINDKVKKEFILKVNPVAEEIKIDKSSISIQLEGSSKINAIVFPEDAVNKDLRFESTNEEIVSVNQSGEISAIGIGECEIKIKTISEPIIETVVNVVVTEKVNTLESNNSNGLIYINGVLIANKKYSLPSDYNPGVDQTALNAYYEMKNAAILNGFSLEIISGFRSYETQKGLYNRYVSIYGQAEADTFSAQPGKSEHQTGLAFDLGWVDDAYADTAEGKWLAENCYKYGFIIRYPKGKESITGYKYEPWHVRYLGNPLATDVYNSGLCLEEYLGI